jgi:hypothetical protein
MRVPRNPRRLAAWAAVVGATTLAMSSCSSPSHPAASSTTRAAAAVASSAGKPVDGCKLVTAQQLTQAVGVQYTAIQGYGSGSSACNVTAAQLTDSFFFIVDKEGAPPDTWDAQVAIIKRDDGSETSVSGIGDRAVQGAVKEFGAEAKGYIVLVTNADFNNPPTARTFARSKRITQLLISKL